jgi:hypothetical protein
LELDKNACGSFYFPKAVTSSLPTANEASAAVDLFGLGGDGQMRSLAGKKPARPTTLTGHDILIMALMISFPVIGLDQFLRTTPAKFSEQPVIQIQHWLNDSLMALPLFAVGVRADDLSGGVGTIKQDHRIVVRGARLGQVDDEALAASPVQVDGLVGERHRADERVPEDLLVGTRFVYLVARRAGHRCG